MNRLYLDIQRFADGKVVIDTELNTKNFENGLNKMKSSSQKAGVTIKNIVVGLGITKLISTAMNQITSSIDGAVTRLDTLNNFPKVMSNLGIASEDAEESIKKMSDKLAGLPTTLDQGASAVQRFTSKNGDVAKSTDLFLALNNAILAGGASSEIQASALEQLSQSYAKGKPDMMEWRTAMTAMPAQLKQVAEAMGYVDADALGEALREGTVSMDDFMNTMVQLNEEGINGFQSFEEQARNSTGGIKTSITVAKTQIVKGVADIIEALDVKMEELGIGKLSDFITNIGKNVKKALDTIADLIKGDISVEMFGDLAFNMIENFANKISENIPTIIQKGGEILSAFIGTLTEHMPNLVQSGMEIVSNLIIGIAQQLPTLIPQAIDALITFVTSLIDNIDLIIDAGIELLNGLVDGLLEAIPKLIEAVPTIIDKLVTKLTDPDMVEKLIKSGITLIVKLVEGLIKAIPKIIAAIPQIIGSLINGIKNYFGTLLSLGGQLLSKLATGIANKIGDIKEKASQIVNTIVNAISQLPGQMLQWGRDMIQGLINGITGMIQKVKDAVSKVANKIKNFLHFSRPDEGPLREYEQWMPDMIKGLASTMQKSSYILSNQSEKLAQQVKDSMDFSSIYDDMQEAVNLEASKIGTSVEISSASRNVQQMLTASASFDGIIPLQVDLDGEVIYDNQQKISARKNLQYGGVKAK